MIDEHKDSAIRPPISKIVAAELYLESLKEMWSGPFVTKLELCWHRPVEPNTMKAQVRPFGVGKLLFLRDHVSSGRALAAPITDEFAYFSFSIYCLQNGSNTRIPFLKIVL
ncbi:hypothetical protein RN02_30015 [Pseudomonas sp. PI1]|nr:hypothetical protein RN02_30015 [Pseudomonas sp. PI1]